MWIDQVTKFTLFRKGELFRDSKSKIIIFDTNYLHSKIPKLLSEIYSESILSLIHELSKSTDSSNISSAQNFHLNESINDMIILNSGKIIVHSKSLDQLKNEIDSINKFHKDSNSLPVKYSVNCIEKLI